MSVDFIFILFRLYSFCFISLNFSLLYFLFLVMIICFPTYNFIYYSFLDYAFLYHFKKMFFRLPCPDISLLDVKIKEGLTKTSVDAVYFRLDHHHHHCIIIVVVVILAVVMAVSFVISSPPPRTKHQQCLQHFFMKYFQSFLLQSSIFSNCFDFLFTFSFLCLTWFSFFGFHYFLLRLYFPLTSSIFF